MSTSIEGYVGNKGNLVITSKHKCYKGHWYYNLKKKYKALKALAATAENVKFDETDTFNEGVAAAVDLLESAGRPKSAKIASGAFKD